jgi:hypothetical protein
MDVQEAVKLAKDWVANVFSEEGITNVGLEEIDYDDEHRIWNVTLGFSRPWNTTRGVLTSLTGDTAVRRTYKILSVSDGDGKVLSLRNRDSG